MKRTRSEAAIQDAVNRGAFTREAAFALLLVFACFTFSSSGYLGWLYRLIEIAPAGSADALALGAGYACQGAGIGIAAILMRLKPGVMSRGLLVGAIASHFACATLATVGGGLTEALVFGCAMSVLCGFVSAYYLLRLSACVQAKRRGIVFGGGYACSTVMTWLLSMASPVMPAGVPNEIVWCAVFSVFAVVIAVSAGELPLPASAGNPQAAKGPSRGSAYPEALVGENSEANEMTDANTVSYRLTNGNGPESPASTGANSKTRQLSGLIAIACIVVLLMSMVKSVGFNFPSADIGQTINLELSRLLYAVGLIVAGIVIDRNRKHGAILCLAALFMPFAMLALSSEPIPSAALWAIDYLFYGFFSVFRVVLFADLADCENHPEVSGFGLMFGRFGDALGAVTCLALANSTIALVAVAAVLFVATILVFVRLFQQLFATQPYELGDADRNARSTDLIAQQAADQAFNSFVERYELSPRERDVMRLILDKRTNPEMANDLVVSENTVKFHVRNVLKKTDCKNRVELLAKFADETQS